MDRETAFNLLLEAHIGLIRKLCRAYSKGYDQEDLVQEVCLQLWRSLESFRGESSETTWIYRITLNVCINQVKKRENPNKFNAEIEFSKEQKLFHGENIKHQQLQQLYDGVWKLKPIDRAIILLYLEKNSHEKIGEIIGMSTTNVSVKVNRIKKELKKIIDNGV